MRSVALAVLLAVPALRVLRGQTPAEPTIVLTFYGGAVTGHALWAVGRQPLCRYVGGTCGSGSVYDTVSVSRSIGSSLGAGLTMTYFLRSAVGVQLDVSFLGLPFENHCAPIGALSADNQALCGSIPANNRESSALSFELGVIARTPARTSTLRPYARLGIGLLSYSGSTVELEGSYPPPQGTKIVIADDNPARSSVSFFGGVGLLANLSPGYVFRLEARDVYARLMRVDGPASDLAVAPISGHFFHDLALSIGFGIVLEHKRGRRY